MKIAKVLSQKEVETLPEGTHNVGGVLGLCIRKQKTTYRYFLRYHIDGRRFCFNLPRGLPLKQVRVLAQTYRQKLDQGINPKEDVKTKKSKVAQSLIVDGMTFRQLTSQWCDYREKIHYWDNRQKEYKVVLARFQKYIYPIIGNKNILNITTDDVVTILSAMNGSESMTEKIKTLLNHVFKWAIVKKYRTDNPVDHACMLMKDMGMKYKDIRNQPSLDFHEVPSFIKRLMEIHTIPSLMFCFSILTCARSQTVRLMTWEEIDFEKKIWTVPEEHDKVKGGTRFRTIMLNEQSLYVLKECKKLQQSYGLNQLVFPNVHCCLQPYSDNFFMSFIRVEHERKKKDDSVGWVDAKTGLRITQHGFRSSFKTWSVSDELGNNKKYDRNVSEYCLLHSKSDPYKGGYERCSFEVARREMMDDWGKWCWSAINNE